MPEFRHRKVVVTGGSAGLGLAIAEAFLRTGAHVSLLARDATRLAQAVERLKPISDFVDSRVADLTDDNSVKSAFASIRDQQSPIHVLVNAAGVSDRAAILDTDPARFQRAWELNFLGVVRCVRAAADDLLFSKGHVVNIGSLASKVAAPYLGSYPASKFALAAYSQQLRLELGPRGLHVLLVCPGPLQRTDSGKRYDELAGDLPETARQPGGGANLTLIDPAELASRIVLACSRRQAELIEPSKVRWLAALQHIWPEWADNIIRRRAFRQKIKS